ncbi:hypothetical protein GIB67_003344 [Kingdonia uniflora]|uniref:CASP-like protein n=1 Tax=Kingdonia uniflora TaxID=39325 RepID=A0A7J7P8V9_9MAGN|nr:hypothetical protein GIB67_003344 [Kingdonia uniflora]
MDKEESITTNTTNTTTTTTNNTSDSDSQMESSPLRFHPTPPIPTSLPQTPLRNPPQKPISMAIVATDQAPIWLSPPQSPPPPPPPLENKPTPQREPVPAERLQVNPLSPVIVVNRLIREELAAVGKIDGVVGGGRDRGVEEERGSGGRRVKTGCSRDRKEGMVNRAALSFRVLEVVFCLISFSVMAADKTQGWAGDSFNRYKEYRSTEAVLFLFEDDKKWWLKRFRA